MPNDVQPLQNRIQIVNPDGTPTDFFIRWARQRQIDISGAITAADAIILINAWALARDIGAGVGLSGGGNLSTDITINLEDTAVTPGAYTNADITVDQQGRITAAANGAGGGGLEIEDEGVSVETGVTLINFTGAGVVATSPVAGEVEVNIAGGSLEIEDEGVSVETGVTKINFIGGGVEATSPGAGEVDVEIPLGLQLIDEFIFTGAESTHTFSSIPTTFKNLRLIVRGRSGAAVISSRMGLRFNGDTGANYRRQEAQVNQNALNGSAAVAQTSINSTVFPGTTAPAGSVGSYDLTIADYLDTNFSKQASGMGAETQGATNATQFMFQVGGSWINSAAITDITYFDTSGSNLVVGSSMRLYGF